MDDMVVSLIVVMFTGLMVIGIFILIGGLRNVNYSRLNPSVGKTTGSLIL
jgi:hypothetical protein